MKRHIHLYKDIHEFQAESTEINQHGYHGPCIGSVRKTVAFVVGNGCECYVGLPSKIYAGCWEPEKKDKLFVHKVPFEFNEELIECILMATQGRKYDTAMWEEEKRIYNITCVNYSTTACANGKGEW